MNKEQWKDIGGWEGFYQVSNMGRLRSLKRPFVPVDKILKPCTDKYGYLFAGLFRGGKRLGCPKMHRLVLEAFVGVRPRDMECRHMDGNRKNNRLDNIEWATHEVNELDKYRHNTIMHGSKNGYSKLTEANIIEMRKLFASNKYIYNSSVLARMFDIAQSCAWNVIHRKSWKHVI